MMMFTLSDFVNARNNIDLSDFFPKFLQKPILHCYKRLFRAQFKGAGPCW
jgi:hypothetical protein